MRALSCAGKVGRTEGRKAGSHRGGCGKAGCRKTAKQRRFHDGHTRQTIKTCPPSGQGTADAAATTRQKGGSAAATTRKEGGGGGGSSSACQEARGACAARAPGL